MPHDTGRELAESAAKAARTQQVDVVRQSNEEALAAGIAVARLAEAPAQLLRQLGHARPGRLRRRLGPSVLVPLGVPLAGEREQPEDLVELLRPGGFPRAFLERQPERVEQRVERVPL